MGSLGQVFDPTLHLHLFPYLMQCCIRHSANTGHLSGASPQFPHHVAYNILLSFFRMKHELCYIACSTMLQNLHSHGLIGNDLPLIHIETANSLWQWHVNTVRQFLHTVSIDNRIRMAYPLCCHIKIVITPTAVLIASRRLHQTCLHRVLMDISE